MDNKLKIAKENLEKNGFKAEIFDKLDKAKEALLKAIGSEESVAFGGSMTLDHMGIYEELVARGNQVDWHWKAEDGPAALKKARNSDIYLSSSNALTLTGKLVSMDGVGNRVSAMIYGHKRVYIIVGRNKLTEDLDEARSRIKNIAARKNAERLNVDVDKICSVEVILHGNTTGSDINVFLVDEDLGY